MTLMPDTFRDWFNSRGWTLRPHQEEMIRRAREEALLLIAPTGGGKTLAGFLPTLIELADGDVAGLHTLYVSPLKALTADMKRNLSGPVSEMELPIRIEDRTGDTGQSVRRRQRVDPPHILLTTPESLALMLTYPEANRVFGSLRRIIFDEIHAVAESKRGDQLMLCASRLQGMAPHLRRVGLSATVRDPDEIADFMSAAPGSCRTIRAEPGPPPDIRMLESRRPPPWSGGGARHAAPDVMNEIRNAGMTLVFINTRAQAELFFQALWNENSEGLALALHHGSLSREARAKVENAMARSELRAVVCTGTLDLGIDWGDVDLVIQVGAPKNIKRLVQRIGRSNHRYDSPSRALIVPANRFEVIECVAALDAVREDDLDGQPKEPGSNDVVCQHIMIAACSGPFDSDALFDEIRAAGPYRHLDRSAFGQCLNFCATGGYALNAYDRWRRIRKCDDGKWRLRDPRIRRSIRMNIGTIVDSEKLKVRLAKRRGGAPLGEVEEAFAATLVPGDTFLIGGETVRHESIREMVVEVSRESSGTPKIAVFSGTKFASSTRLCHRVLDLLQAGRWPSFPDYIRNWLQTQNRLSRMPRADRLLVESFRHDGKECSCLYGFAGRNAQQTLGLVLTRRMEKLGLNPLGFVSNDYAVLIWGLTPIDNPAALFDGQDLRDGLDSWLAENAVMKRTFRGVATVSGLIERTLPGRRRTGRQVTFSTDIIYDTLRKYDPEHILLNITREEAMRGLVDFSRIEEMVERIGGRIDHITTERVTPFAAPLLLEAGTVPIRGKAEEILIEEIALRSEAPDAEVQEFRSA